MKTNCSECGNDMTPPNDNCKCKERCGECRSMFIEDGKINHEEGCSKVENSTEIKLNQADFKIGKMGDTEGDSYLNFDCHHYIYSEKFQTRKDVERILDLIGNPDDVHCEICDCDKEIK